MRRAWIALLLLVACRAPRELPEAARRASAAEIEALLAADPSAMEREGEDGRRALAVAAAAGNTRAMRVLLTNGAKIDAVDATGRAALHHAAAEGQLEAVSLLLSSGADASLQDAEGHTPRRLAVLAREYDTEDVLRFHKMRIATRFGKETKFVDAPTGAGRAVLREGEEAAALVRFARSAVLQSEEPIRVLAVTSGMTISAGRLTDAPFTRGAMLFLPAGAKATARCAIGTCLVLEERRHPKEEDAPTIVPLADWREGEAHGRIDSVGANTTKAEIHAHDFELVVVTLTGDLGYETDDGRHMLPPGSYAYIAPRDRHGPLCLSQAPCERYVIDPN